MKKLIVSFILVGLVSGSMLGAIHPADIWRCRSSNLNPNPPCSQQQREYSRKWFKNAKIGALVALSAALASIGIAVGVRQLQKQKETDTSTTSSPMTDGERMEKAMMQGQTLQGMVNQASTAEQLKEQARIELLKESRKEIGEIEQAMKKPGITKEEFDRLQEQKRKLQEAVFSMQ